VNKTELLEELEDSRQEFMELINDLPDSAMLEPGVSGSWSIKDILAHLVHWEGQTITLLFQVAHGVDRPTTVHFGKETVDELNERWNAESQSRSLDQIWNDFKSIRKQTIRRVSEFSESDLTDPSRFPWMNGVALIELINRNTFEHDEEHGDAIREWLDQRDARNNGSEHR